MKRENDEKNTSPKRSFKSWLLKHRKHQNWLGDLARDLRQDLREARRDNEPSLPKPFTGRAFLTYLNDRGACDGAISACEEAYRLAGGAACRD
jgi:hypothetical protein